MEETEEQTQGQEESSEEITFTPAQQAFLDKKIGQARVKAREIAETKFRQESEAAKTAAQQEELEQSEEWKKLAQHHESRVKELEPLEARVKQLGEFVDGLLKRRIKDLGDVAKKAVAGLPGELDSLAKLAWLEENADLFKDQEAGPVRAPGTPKARARKPAQQTEKPARASSRKHSL